MSAQSPLPLDTSVPLATAENASSSSSVTNKDVPARILKKRESDRRSQRIKRERTKSKIAALEEKVRSLGDKDSSGQIQLLMKQLQEVERERDDLAKKVRTIEGVIYEGNTDRIRHHDIALGKDNSIPRHVSPSATDCIEYSNVDASNYINNDEIDPDSFDAGTPDDVEAALDIDDLSVNYDNSTSNGTPQMGGGPNQTTIEVSGTIPSSRNSMHPCHQHSVQPCECCITDGGPGKQSRFNTWRFTNQVLSARFSWPTYFRLLQDTYRDDIPVRVVVEGWDAVEARGPVHPSWQILKKIDQVLFGRCGPKERLAVIYATQLLLMSHTTPEELPDLPNFYRKRPSQNLADSYAIHFFPWPGMRERFVFNQHRYCSNDFWKTFIDGLRIIWPFEFRDCYTKNLDTGLYSISPLFQERVNDIKCWAMESDVFAKWPELHVDIPAYNTLPRSISNIVERPRTLKPVHRLMSNANRKPQQEAQEHVLRHGRSSRSLAYPAVTASTSTSASAPAYHIPLLPSNANQTIMSNVNWASNPPQQPQQGVNYYDSLMNEHVTMNFT